MNFGERVPIYKEALAGTDEEFYPPQANPGELVSLIETELKEVQSDLPESYEESEKDVSRVIRQQPFWVSSICSAKNWVKPKLSSRKSLIKKEVFWLDGELG